MKLGYSEVAATLALVLAMGGTAVAVSTALPPDSVDTAAIQDHAVTGPKLAANAVGNNKLSDNAVSTIKLQDGSVTGPKLAAGSVGNANLAAGSVTHSKLGASSIDGSNVASDSISLADIVGADRSGTISFSLPANGCGTLSLGVSGAQPGQVVVFSFTGTVAIPSSVVFGSSRVTSAGHITTYTCNVGSSPVSVSGLGIRVVTFG